MTHETTTAVEQETNEPTREVIRMSDTYPTLALSAEAFLRRNFETAHLEHEISDAKAQYLEALAEIAMQVLTPIFITENE